jgi:histidinol-phosphate/aromatic aminotransferase/cobyric acid decarboxylase-like protein
MAKICTTPPVRRFPKKLCSPWAKSPGARVLVDEVYLEAVYPRPATALRLGPEFVVTSSLTKAYGLSGLRCGWILAEPALARRLHRLNDLFGGPQPHPADRLSLFAFHHMDRVAGRARRLLAANRPLVSDFMNSREETSLAPPPGSLIEIRFEIPGEDAGNAGLGLELCGTVVRIQRRSLDQPAGIVVRFQSDRNSIHQLLQAA